MRMFWAEHQSKTVLSATHASSIANTFLTIFVGSQTVQGGFFLFYALSPCPYICQVGVLTTVAKSILNSFKHLPKIFLGNKITPKKHLVYCYVKNSSGLNFFLCLM